MHPPSKHRGDTSIYAVLAELGRRKQPMPLMHENAAFQQDKSHKPLAYLAAGRIFRTKFRLKYSHVFDSPYTSESLACCIHRKLEGKAGQACSKTNDKLNISNSQNYPFNTVLYPVACLPSQKRSECTSNLKCSRSHQNNHDRWKS